MTEKVAVFAGQEIPFEQVAIAGAVFNRYKMPGGDRYSVASVAAAVGTREQSLRSWLVVQGFTKAERPGMVVISLDTACRYWHEAAEMGNPSAQAFVKVFILECLNSQPKEAILEAIADLDYKALSGLLDALV
jgi:hypothetical protein